MATGYADVKPLATFLLVLLAASADSHAMTRN